jgi:hypothetical protein
VVIGQKHKRVEKREGLTLTVDKSNHLYLDPYDTLITCITFHPHYNFIKQYVYRSMYNYDQMGSQSKIDF